MNSGSTPPTEPVKLVTQAEYARLRGVVRSAVTKALRTGRIHGVERGGRVMIDPAAADLQWAERTQVDQQLRGAPEQFERTHWRARSALRAGAGDVHTSPPKPSQAPLHGDGRYDSPELVEARLGAERARCELLQFRVSERLSQLVRRDEVEAAFAIRLEKIRNIMEAIPAAVISKLLAMEGAERTEGRVHEVLRVTITDAMTRSVASD